MIKFRINNRINRTFYVVKLDQKLYLADPSVIKLLIKIMVY